MKKLIFIIVLFLPVWLFSQSNQGQNITVNKMKLNGIIYADKSGAIDTLIVVNSDSTGYRYLNVSEPVDSSDAVNLAYFLRYAAAKDSDFVSFSLDTLFIGGDTIINANFLTSESLFIADSANIVHFTDTLSGGKIATKQEVALKQYIITNLGDTTKYLEVEVDPVFAADSANLVRWADTLTGGNIGTKYEISLKQNTITNIADSTKYIEITDFPKFDRDSTDNITGSGTDNRISRFNGTNALENSGIADNSDTLAITIDASENVGLGTASPSQKLEVNGNIIVGNTGSSTYPYLKFNDTTIGSYIQSVTFDAFLTNNARNIDGTNWVRDNEVYGAMVLRLRSNSFRKSQLDLFQQTYGSGTFTLPTASLSVDENGNVGINTTTPTEKLDVNGNAIADTFKIDTPISVRTGSNQAVGADSIKKYTDDIATTKQNTITNLADTSKYLEVESQVLSISNDTVSLTGGSYVKLPATGIDGSGTANYIPKFSDSNTLADSPIRINGDDVGIGIDPSSGFRFEVQDSTAGFMAHFINKQAGDGFHIQTGTNASSDVPLKIELYNGTDLLNLQGNGRLTLNGYGSGGITGTEAYNLGVTSTGLLIETTPVTGGDFSDPMTTIGDIIIRNGANSTTRLAIGTDGQILTVASGIPSWQNNSGSSVWSFDGLMNSYKTASEYPLSLLDGQGIYWYTSFPSTLEMALWESSSGVYSLQAQGYNPVLSARTNGTMDLFGRNLNAIENTLTDDSTKIPTSHAVSAAITAGGGYTDEMAQDAVGTILRDSTHIDFAYVDETPIITATLKANSLDTTLLNDTQFYPYVAAHSGGGSMTWPGAAGIAVYNGSSAWGTSITDNSANWNTAYNDKINSAAFNTSDGIITLTQQDAGTVTVDIDGRFLTAEVDGNTANEGALDVAAGGANSSAITSNTSGDADVYIKGNTGILITETADTIFVAPDTTFLATLNDIVAGGSYTDEQAQDAVGSMLSDAGDIDFTYTDETPAVTAAIKANSIDSAMFNATEVNAYISNHSGSGGDGTVTAVIAGAGMDFETITSTDTVKLGLPSTITGTTTNLVSATSHTHEIAETQADGSTQGVASFTAADFNATAGNISIDYTNGQKATTSQPGFLTDGDWDTLMGKQNAISNLADTAKYWEKTDTATFVATKTDLAAKQNVISNLADTAKYIEYGDTTSLIAMQWELDLKQNVISNIADTSKYWEKTDTSTYLATQYDLTLISGGNQDLSGSGATLSGYTISLSEDASPVTLPNEADGSVNNEGSLSVAAGSASTSIIQSNTSGSSTVTIEAGTGMTISESGTTITLASTAGTNYWEDLTGEIAPADSANEVLIGTKADNGAYLLQVDGNSFFRDDVRIEGISPTFLLGNSTNNSLAVGLTDGPGEVSLGVSSTGTGGTHTNIMYLNPVSSTTLVDMSFSNDVSITDSLSAGRILSNYGIGEIDTMLCDTTIAAGNLCVLTAVGMELVDADDENRTKGMLGIALESATAGNTGKKFLLKGNYTTSGLTKGAVYYISNTTGGWTSTRTTTANDWVRVIGYAKSATILYFDPSPTWIKLK